MTAYDPQKHGALCATCPRKGCTPVPPEGRPGLRACLLGQDPGANEVRLLRPFVGATGTRLTHLLQYAHAEVGTPFERGSYFITNAALCAPLTKSEKEARGAVDACRPRLLRELAGLTPRAGVLAMGKWAYYALTGSDTGMGKYQGFHVELRGRKALPGTSSLWFEPVIHPAATFRQPDALPPLQAHVSGYVHRLTHGFGRQPALRINPGVEELRALVSACRMHRKALAVDVESMPPPGGPKRWALLPGFARLRAIGVGADVRYGVGLSWEWPIPVAGVLPLLREVFADSGFPKVLCKGYYYDVPLLERHGFQMR